MSKLSDRAEARFHHLRTATMAAELGVSEDYIRARIRSGEIAARNIGSDQRPEYRVHPDVWDAWLRSRDVEGAA